MKGTFIIGLILLYGWCNAQILQVSDLVVEIDRLSEVGLMDTVESDISCFKNKSIKLILSKINP